MNSASSSLLFNKTCKPCQGEESPLEDVLSNALLQGLDPLWTINSAGHLQKKYIFRDFVCAMHFANQITLLAEAENHHPDIKISFGSCEIELWTHKINGLSESDFILAAKIDLLPL